MIDASIGDSLQSACKGRGMRNKRLWKRAVRAMPGSTHLITLYRFAKGTDARYASLWRRALPGLFQPFATTRMNRYPTLFLFALATLGDDPSTRLLSFGCSTGEEVFSLRRYFPQAVIRRIDINPRNIARCRARLSRLADDRLSFAVAASAAGEEAGGYDAVFAMAVFRHGGWATFPRYAAI